ncbi:MAG: arylesterase [Gammaproteobacteria bacterium]|nr:arylesterase [Gammaproteobacteria bacterium]
MAIAKVIDRFRGLLLVIFLALMSGCGGDTPRLPRLATDAVLLAFGDSLTFGTGASGERSYPAVLATLIEHEVVRSGVPGELSRAGLARLPEVLDRVHPAVLLLCHGGNDLLRKQPVQQLRENLAAMIAAARERSVAVVLIGVPQPTVFNLQTADVYRQVATAADVPLVEDALADILGDQSLKSDTVHPNARGYEKLAQAVADLLKEAGAL